MDKRKKLLELIEKQNVSLPPGEAKEQVENLTNEEVELLVSVYGDLGEAEGAIEEVLSETEPDKYKKLKDEYLQKQKANKQEYEKDLEEISVVFENKIEKTEDEVVKDARKLAEGINEEVNKMEKQGEEILKIADSSLK